VTAHLSPALKRFLGILVAVMVSGVLLYLSLKGIDPRRLLTTFAHANLAEMLAVFAVLSATFVCRAARWRLIIQTESDVTLWDSFRATMVGYLGNSLLPARAGEALRCVMINRTSATGFGTAAAGTLTERLGDTLALVLIGVACSSLNPALPGYVRADIGFAALVLTLAIVVLSLVSGLRKQIDSLVERLPLPHRVRALSGGVVTQFFTASGRLRSAGLAVRFVGLTAIIWALDVLAVFVMARALGFQLDVVGVATLIVALGLASAAPSTPGYLGVFQVVGLAVLTPLGVDRVHALDLVFLIQIMNLGTAVLYGGYGLLGLYPLPRRLIPTATGR
jgi:glycosyltransferase 2 family protein